MPPKSLSKRPSSPEDGDRTAKAIRRWREVASMSREEVAVLCEKSASTVERWERALTEPSISDVRRMEATKRGLVSLLFRA